MRYKFWFWITNIVLTSLRLLIIGGIGLTIDEAHYWVYTKFLDLSYFDHPPFIAYLIKASTFFFGNNEFAIRFPTVIIFFFVNWIFFICAKKLYNEKTAFIGALLLNILPVFSFLGSVIALPDSPLALFWMLALLVFIFLIETNNKNYWYLLGIITGFAMLAKYNAVLIPFSIFIFLVLSKTNRFWLKKQEPYLALIISMVMVLPVIIWNIENNWASFGFQLTHGLGSSLPKISLTLFGRSVGAQAGYISPLLFLFFIVAAFFCVKDAYKNKNQIALIISCFSLPVLFLFNGIAIFNEILPHWPAMGYLVLLIYVAHLTSRFWRAKWFRIYSYAAYGLALFMIITAVLHIFYKVIPIEKLVCKEQAEKIRHGIYEPERIDISNEVYGWKEIGNEIRRTIKIYPPEKKPFIFTHKSYLASQLAAAVPELVVFCISDKINAYDFWQTNLSDLKNRDGLFICNDYFFADPKEKYGDQVFTTYTDIEKFPIYRNGRKIKNFFFTVCKSFNPSKLPHPYAANVLKPKKDILKELIKCDHMIFKFINFTMKSKFVDFLIMPISYCDSKGFNISLCLMIAAYIFILRKNKKDHFWTTLIIMVGVLIIVSILTHLLKSHFGRLRPLSVFGDKNVNILLERLNIGSFPSGHTGAAVALCTFMFMFVRKYWYLYIAFALCTGFYRIYVGSHFPLDVMSGAVIGIFFAYVTTILGKKMCPKI
ncbi:MAG: glycosyltransferase family 39 protein [Endomicrobium sp.]|jgi:membrane-associated phospholipid phosphatase|nr:glycosyltransferase family 39 protein [Endomicrobium sp.]